MSVAPQESPYHVPQHGANASLIVIHRLNHSGDNAPYVGTDCTYAGRNRCGVNHVLIKNVV